MPVPKPDREKAADIVRDAGGKIIGRTKLQKITYLLELAGFGEGFYFEYRHYGPYSEQLADAIQMAEVFDLISEEERKARWGGYYSIFEAADIAQGSGLPDRVTFATAAGQIDSIELELAATAAYLHAVEKCPDPWGETARRKPEKTVRKRLERAKDAYRRLRELKSPTPLPEIV